jgi:hypothetical protein
MKRIYGFIISLYLNNVFIIWLDIFIIIIAKNVTPDFDRENIESNKPLTMVLLIWGIWFLLFMITTIINAVNVIKKFIKKETNLLLEYTKKVKLGLIPFWIINFVGYTAFVIMVNLPSHGFGIFIVPFPIMASYFVLITTSVLSILLLLLLYKEGKINNKQFLIYVITQLCFVLDIVGIIHLLYARGLRTLPPQSPTMVKLKEE